MIEPKLTVSNGTVRTYIEIDNMDIEAIAHEYWAAKEKDRKEASLLLQQLPNGWWAEEQEWFCNKDKSKKRKTK